MSKYYIDRVLARDFDGLVHPSEVFDHPADVVNDPDISLNEKRAILASWASDACAIEAAPGLSAQGPAGRAVPFDEIMEALRTLDKQMAATQMRRRSARLIARSTSGPAVSGSGTQGAPLH
jgi:hypothetical protein